MAASVRQYEIPDCKNHGLTLSGRFFTLVRVVRQAFLLSLAATRCVLVNCADVVLGPSFSCGEGMSVDRTCVIDPSVTFRRLLSGRLTALTAACKAASLRDVR